MDNSSKISFFINPRLLFILAFGFSSGLPFALTGSTLQAWLTEANISLMAIGALSLISFPYNCKFLWAPLLDRFIFKGLGRRRGWILLTQLCLVGALFFLAGLQPQSHMQTIGWVVLFIAFFSATQDIAIDAYRADVLPVHERGLGAAYFIFAYRMSMFVSGGLALVIASYWGWGRTYQFMGALMLLNMVVTYFAPEKQVIEPYDKGQSYWAFFMKPFLDFWNRDHVFLQALFVIFYKAGAALSFALMTNFLLHQLGFTLVEIGVAFKAVSIIGTLLGGIVGGAFLCRLGLYASLFWFALAQAIAILPFMLLAYVGKVFSLMLIALFADNFCNGMSTAAFLAFLMALCNVRYTATQFAFLSAIDSLGRLFAGPLAAILVTNLGWIPFYGWSFIVALLPIPLLLAMRKKVKFDGLQLASSKA
jgi:MFS transporter, PAT family, beta-lactamase induction signal transducer AmpG